jgi:uncharacterized protein
VSAPAPLDDDTRLHALDILRGLALFGMIVVHFHQRMRLDVSGLEDLIGWAVWVLLEQKAWGTFAFLFGVGFAILLRRLEARGQAVVPLYLRRLAGLAAFGLVAQIGFGFSILLEYACWGVALLVLRRWPTRLLFATAVLAASARPIYDELTALQAWHAGMAMAPSPAAAALARAAAEAARQSHYGVLLHARWALFLGTLPHTVRAFLPDVNLALFILGLLAVRHGVLDDPRRHARLIAGWMLGGFVAWAVAWLALYRVPELPIPGTRDPIAYGFGLVQDQWLCLTYIGAVVLLLAYRPEWTRRLAPVGRAGRMALTNYLLQAAVLDLLGSGYGFGLRIRPLLYLPAALLLFGLEVGVSSAWLARYRYGPLEWLWRSFTYARIQPLARRPACAPGISTSPSA